MFGTKSALAQFSCLALLISYHCIESFRILNTKTAFLVQQKRTYRLYTQESTLKKIISDNRKSSFEYEFTETYEAGIVLQGTEVKSCRKGTVQLSDAVAEIIDGECWLVNCHIAEYQKCGRLQQHKLKRKRKLLLHSKEVRTVNNFPFYDLVTS